LHFSDIIEMDGVFYQIAPIRRIEKKDFSGNVYNLTVAKDHSYTTSNFVVGNCGVGGNVFNFLMKYERLEFPEAVRMLAQKAGVAIPVQAAASASESSLNNKLYAANEMAVSYFQRNLDQDRAGRASRDYLRQRGLSDETIRAFSLGFAASGWDGLVNFARQKNITADLLEKAGLAIAREGGGYFDRFRNRIMFPILDLKSRILGFGGRVVSKEDGPKYMNSPETSIYNKGRNLYGLNLTWKFIRDADQVVIVEGYLDLIVPFQFGVNNIVASLGTSLTEDQIRLLARYTKNAVIIFDPDRAGEFATLRSLDLLISEDFRIGVVRLPDGYDPDSFVRKDGAAEFKKRIAQAKSLFDYKMSVLVTRHDRSSLEGKAKIVEEMLPTIAKIPNAVLKSGYIRTLADNLAIEEAAVREELKKVRPDYSSARTAAAGADSTPKAGSKKCKLSEKILAGLLVDDNNYIKMVRENLTLEDFQDPVIRSIVEVLFRCQEESKAVTPGKLMSYLDDGQAHQLIPELVDCVEAIVDKKKTFADCILKIKQDNLKEKLNRLQVEIALAQSRADEDRITRLITECNALLRSIKVYEGKTNQTQGEAVKT
jgi:DNA primase